MWKKIKSLFFCSNPTIEDISLAEIIKEEKYRKANQTINDQITDAVTVKKKRTRKPKE